MSFIIKKNIWDLKASVITDEKFFNSRRKILKNLVKGSVLYAGLSSIPQRPYFRVSYATSLDLLNEAMNRIEKAILTLR